MLRRNLARSMIAALAVCAFAAHADDSAFKTEAQMLHDLHLAKLRAAVAAEEQKLREAAPPHPIAEAGATTVKLRPATVVEIGGADGRYTATIRMPDGELRDVTTGQTVPGFGRVAVTADGLRDDRGRLHNPGDR